MSELSVLPYRFPVIGDELQIRGLFTKERVSYQYFKVVEVLPNTAKDVNIHCVRVRHCSSYIAYKLTLDENQYGYFTRDDLRKQFKHVKLPWFISKAPSFDVLKGRRRSRLEMKQIQAGLDANGVKNHVECVESDDEMRDVNKFVGPNVPEDNATIDAPTDKGKGPMKVPPHPPAKRKVVHPIGPGPSTSRAAEEAEEASELIKTLEKKLKGMQDMFNSEMEKIQHRLCIVETRQSTLSQDIHAKDLVPNDGDDYEIVGGWPISSRTAYDRLPAKTKATYSQGGHYNGARLKSRLVCSNYRKQGVDTHGSPKVIKVKDPEDPNKEINVWYCKESKSVDIKIFGWPSLKKMAISEAIQVVRLYAVCTDCAKGAAFMKLYDKVCPICLESSTDTANDGLKLCVKCQVPQRQDKVSQVLKRCVETLLKTYNFVDWHVGAEYSTGSKTNDDLYKIDLYAFFRLGAMECHIIIERDENQHKGYSPAGEASKMFIQTRNVMGSPTNGLEKRVLMIRFNPDAEYPKMPIEDAFKSPPFYYNQNERLLILRQWINWWIQNIGQMRTMTLWYMWYETSMENRYVSGYDGYAMLYNPPALPEGKNSWKYLMTPYDYTFSGTKNIQRTFTDPDTKYKWCKRDSIDEFPKHFFKVNKDWHIDE